MKNLQIVGGLALASLFGIGLACGDSGEGTRTDAVSDSMTIAGSESGSGGTTAGPGTTGTTGAPPTGGATMMGTTTDVGTDTTTSGSTSVGATEGDDPVIEVTIAPLDPLVVVVDGAVPPPLEFTATGHTMGGEEVPLTGTWEYDNPQIGIISANNGLFSATGDAGGVGIVHFAADGLGLEAETTATVKLQITSEPEPVDPGIKDMFDGAVDPDPAMTLLYPYDQTVFPRGLAGPTIQWNGGNPGDIYYIHAESPTFEFEFWGAAPPPSRYNFPQIPEDVWVKLTASTDGDVQVDIQRYDGNQAYLAETQTWTIAPSNLTGAIYYWEINNGNVVRLSPGDAAPENFIQKPPGVSCVACHSVSADGSTIAASFHGGYSPWGSIDADSGATHHNSELSSGFQAISPDGGHVLWGHWNNGSFGSDGKLTLSEYNSNAGIAELVPPPGNGAPGHQAWSNDGNQIAFSMRTDGNGLDFTQSTLWLADVDLMNFTFSNIGQLVDKDAMLPTTTFPTYCPDSQWVAFQRSNQARARGGLGELWMVNIDGQSPVRLARANGEGAISAEQQLTNFEPTFLPVAVGGYYWLVFGSERMYGNTLTDTNPNTRFKQLWVTAIDANPEPGADNSHPAFWLPGQELNNQNMRGFWALGVCKGEGELCEAGYECCGGFCTGNPKTCNVTNDGCSELGDACEDASDCCLEVAECINGFCSVIPG